MSDYAAARLNMVEGQLRTNRVTEPALLAAFLAVPREPFVPAALNATAYVDDDVPLGGGRCLMEPLVLARLIQLADLAPEARVLLVGAATGYAAAVLARVTGSVVALESDAAMVATARRLMTELGCGNASVVQGPLAQGYPAGAPYDAIVFGGAIAAVPDAIAGQLAPGGRIVAVMLPERGVGQATVMTRVGSVLSRRPHFDAATPMLSDFAPRPGFEF